MEQLNRFYFYDRVSRQVVNDLPQRILELLTAAVRKRLQGDTPWAVMLSGGLDSSAVAAIASRLAATECPDYPVTHSFCIGLKGSPDLKLAREVASHLGTRPAPFGVHNLAGYDGCGQGLCACGGDL